MRRLVKRKPLAWINGRRGAFQLFFAVVYWSMAVAMTQRWPATLAWLDEYISHWCLVLVWGIPAATACVGAFLPRPKDALSFGLLAAAPLVMGFLFLIGYVLIPGTGSPFGLIVYWALAGAVMVVSGMTGDSDRDEREVQINGA